VVVIGGGMISDYAEVQQVRKQRACEMLDAWRDRLADYYSRGGRMENEGWEMRLAANCTLSEWLRDYDEVRVWRGDVKAALAAIEHLRLVVQSAHAALAAGDVADAQTILRAALQQG
jgi:hypothetical protein